MGHTIDLSGSGVRELGAHDSPETYQCPSEHWHQRNDWKAAPGNDRSARKRPRIRCDAEPVGLLDGPDLRLDPGFSGPCKALVGDDSRAKCEAGSRERIAGPYAPLHRPDVERKPPARGRAGRLGRNRPRFAHGLAALGWKARGG